MNSAELKEMSTVGLANELNRIDKEIGGLCIEYNQVIRELWYRFPNLVDDPNLEPKAKSKILKNVGVSNGLQNK